METYYKAINWNEIEDAIDKSTWEKLTEQFWLDTRIPLSNDLDDWRKLSAEEKDLVGKVFGGLTLLDTMQSQTGVEAIRADVRTPHEEAVLNNIQFMESVHAKSYSSIFSTLNTKSEIEEISSGQTVTNTSKPRRKSLTISMKMERLFRKRLLQHILKHSFSIQGSSLHSIILVITSWLMSLKSLSSLSVTNLFTEPILAINSN